MQISTYQNTNNVLFISGMFAGGWTWKNCQKGIVGNQVLIEEPLMGISNDVYYLIDRITDKINTLPHPVTVVGGATA